MIWFTSDLHFGHVNILKYAPQRYDYLGLSPDATVEDMNEGIVRLWNRQVAPFDHVYIIGDVATGLVTNTIQYVKQLNGSKFLVPGNHDRIHPITHRSDEKIAQWRQVYADVGLIEIGLEQPMVFDGVVAHVCHFPYTGDSTENERYTQWRPADLGMPLVHGHIHDQWATNGRMYNVGIDAWDGQFQSPEAIGRYFRSL